MPITQTKVIIRTVNAVLDVYIYAEKMVDLQKKSLS